MTEKEKIYRETPALHYSLLSKLDKDTRIIPKEEEEGQKTSKYQNFSSIGDKLLFEKDDFFNEYYIIDFKMPSEAIKDIIDEIYRRAKSGILDERLDPKTEEE